ncbi:MAG TPA: MarC family protein [Edaphocola sp.]|nr:MarC family protein [Edaphocola sp.]
MENFDFKEIVTVSLTLFAVIDILGSIPLLISMKQKMGGISAWTATVVSGALMVVFFMAGGDILAFMGLDISSFALAGSIIIFILGMEMILGIELFKPDGGNAKTGSIVPIAFPMIAGSGTLTTILSLKASYSYYSVLTGIVINLIIIYLGIRLLDVIERLLGPGGILVIRKFFGVILIAIAIKIFKENLTK